MIAHSIRFLQLTADVIRIIDIAMEIIGVRSTSAAAIELGKTLTLVLCIDITAFELVADIISYHTGIHIAHEELLVTHELVAGI